MTAEGDHLALAPYDDAEFFGAFLGAGIDAWPGSEARSTTIPSTAPWELRAIHLR